MEAVIRGVIGPPGVGLARGSLVERNAVIDLTARDDRRRQHDGGIAAPVSGPESEDGPMRPHYAYGATRPGVRTVHLVLESDEAALCGTAVPSWLQTPYRPERVTVCSRCRVLRRAGDNS